jgi:putative ABC transport system permease protein
MVGWLKSLFSNVPRESQLDSELRFHVERLTEEYIGSGLSPSEARRKALMDFGGQEQTKEELRDVHRIPALETATANFKSAFRFLRKSPSFSLAMVLTLALGIGANSAVFSAIDAILLRPLPFPDADQLMRVTQHYSKASGPPITAVAPVRLEDWSRLNSTFQALNGYYTEDVSETTGMLPEKATRAWVYPHFFEVWQVPPGLGREFNSAEEAVNGPNAVIISDRFWRRRFASDPYVLGKTLRLDGALFPIIGVMPPSFLFPNRDVDLWMPIPTGRKIAQNRKLTWFTVVGRLKPELSIAQARADLAAVQAQLGRQFPETDADITVGVQPLKDFTIGESRRSLWLLFASVSLLLLIACTNIATLLLSRSAQRRQEIAIRFSLGAPRSQLITQLLTETFVLAVIGSAVGLFLAAASARVFRSLAADLPRVEEIHLDARIVLYALGCSLFVTFLCGLIPAIASTRRSLSSTLAQNSRSQVSGRSGLQWTLTAVQVSLAVALLAGAGLLFRSFQQIGRVNPGFDPSHILSFQLSLNYGETADMKKLQQFTDRVLETLHATPGAEDSALSVGVPGNPFRYETELKLVEGRADTEPKMIAENRYISSSYFSTLGIPLMSGESCHATIDGTPTAVVNRSFADSYLKGSAAIGHHLKAENLGYKDAAEIVGISADAREAGLDHAPVPTVYWCTPIAEPGTYFLVRSHAAPLSLVESIRRKLQQIEPTRAVFDMAPLDQHFSDALAENRLRTVLLSFFAATAILLACIGLYGTLSYSVTLRRREVGLRLALGAARSNILNHFLARALGICAIGCIAGSVLAAAGSRLIASMLYGVSPSDATTFASVFAAVLLVAAFASLAPALRASRTDPMQVLRDE